MAVEDWTCSCWRYFEARFSLTGRGSLAHHPDYSPLLLFHPLTTGATPNAPTATASFGDGTSSWGLSQPLLPCGSKGSCCGAAGLGRLVLPDLPEAPLRARANPRHIFRQLLTV